ncbi:hypothetical protein SNOG_05876 [Parastagonospora nodorum SN15]|uniref:Uncharacterized protein n=1 Tax=Phaeosphaeria nodorum (strain SN15 / ATCC MYA-4574 / FGSC 10173) TaxID=321614 RepID=Q0UQT8_PHANO|nr:hypothetical protein SNOG_05876 [Parastagonospora nodorum SN15]EAT86940.2 hypothetical protein SNOG_05876 [Parastagonospora nodorum SN15]
MVGRFQPYLYDAPVDDSTFNPKAVTMASRMPPSPPKKKQEGPLIDFNKHPDSYLILPYGNTNAKPMNKKTKTFIKIARWPGADLVICLYAIYHLVRNAKSRPPGSSASYHFFALVTDAGFIPFYVFTVLLSRRNSDMEAGTVGRWRTMFPTDEETNKVLLTTWLTSIAVAGLHLISLFLDMYLLVIFRKIAKLPPDMNPLEDNLTSRRKTKHKHKNSSISALTPLTGDQEKRFSNLSSQSTVPGDRLSQMDPLISRDIPSPHKHQVAFMHTRTNSDMTYSPHIPHSARQSKERFSMYSQPATAHQSRRDLNHRDDLHKRDDMDDNETLAQRKSMLAQQANIKRHARAESYITNSSKENFYTPPATARSDKQPGAGDHSLQRNSRETLQNDNWFVHPDEENAPEPEQQYAAPATTKQSMFSTKNQSNQGYNTLSPYDDDVSDVEQEYELDQAMAPQPLPTNGVRSGASPANSPSTSPSKPSYRTQQPNHFPSATKQYISNTPPPSSHSPVKASPFTLDKKSYTSVRRTGDIGYQPVKGQSPRVVSRSGVDYINPYEFDDSDIATGRRRDVSGKVAEEGRGGWGMGGMTFRKISGMA